MIFLRDLFGVREELSNELYCYQNHGAERYHWSKLPQFYYNYRIPPRPIVRRIQLTELHEQCFHQFTRGKSRSTNERTNEFLLRFSAIRSEFLRRSERPLRVFSSERIDEHSAANEFSALNVTELSGRVVDEFHRSTSVDTRLHQHLSLRVDLQ